MSALGSLLVVFSDLALCDGYQHEIRLITDGTHGYAYPVQHGGIECPLIARTEATVTVTCNQPVGLSEEPCHGHAEYRLDTPAWLSVSLGDGPEALDLLTRYGSEMDR